jgi:hypothetical protein
MAEHEPDEAAALAPDQLKAEFRLTAERLVFPHVIAFRWDAIRDKGAILVGMRAGCGSCAGICAEARSVAVSTKVVAKMMLTDARMRIAVIDLLCLSRQAAGDGVLFFSIPAVYVSTDAHSLGQGWPQAIGAAVLTLASTTAGMGHPSGAESPVLLHCIHDRLHHPARILGAVGLT